MKRERKTRRNEIIFIVNNFIIQFYGFVYEIEMYWNDKKSLPDLNYELFYIKPFVCMRRETGQVSRLLCRFYASRIVTHLFGYLKNCYLLVALVDLSA